MAANLPTKHELNTLYKKKGKEALVWLAWRNTLRTLPLSGRLIFQDTWNNNHRHVFSVCRIPLILANIPSVGILGVADAATDAADTAYTYTDYSNTAFAEATAYAAVSTVAKTNSSIIIEAAITTGTISEAAALAYSETYVTTDETNVIAAARADFNFLKTLTPITNNWFSRPLWNKNWQGSSNLELFYQRLQWFLDNLHSMDFGFLADDLKHIYKSEEADPVKQHWIKYLEKPSDVVFKNPKSLRRFIFGETEQINAVRILLLGPGGAGKTTLADRLKGETEIKQHKATVGIDYLDHQALILKKNKGAFAGLDIPENLKLFLWDFGGQTLFHGLHQAFLHENCVYVLVVDSRHEQEPDEWLYQIRHLAKSKNMPPVIIVVNEYENCQNPQNQTRLQQLFHGKLQFCYLRCNDPKDKRLDNFKHILLKVAANARYSVTKNVLDAGEKLKSQLYIKPIISREDLRGYLRTDFFGDEMDDVTAQLEGIGYLVPVDTNQGDFCLNPTWTIDHAYQFLQLDCVKNSQGVVNRNDFDDAAWDLSRELKIKKTMITPC